LERDIHFSGHSAIGNGWMAGQKYYYPAARRDDPIWYPNETAHQESTDSDLGVSIGNLRDVAAGSEKSLSGANLGKMPQWVSDFDMDLIFALIIVACFSLAASAIGVRRLHLYGILFGFGSFISTVLLVYQDLKFQYPLLVAGLIVVTMGTIVLIRFLCDYPLHYKVA